MKKSKSKSKKKSKRQVGIHPYLPFLMMLIGVMSITYSAKYWYFRYQSLALQNSLVQQHAQANPSESFGRGISHIKIETLVDVPVKTHLYLNGTWTTDETVASYLAQSATPGQAGNIIIYGHNKRNILGNIRVLDGNEIVMLTTEDGATHQYRVESVHEVNPSETKYLQPTDDETLTIYTCSGLLDQKRFIVRAKPV